MAGEDGGDGADDDGQQKLQRQIANSRGVAPDVSLTSPTQPSIEELRLQDPCRADPPKPESRETVGIIITKRKYRRHPKVSLS